MEQVSFNTHHSAFGAYSSFILGKIGKGGGFVLNNVKPVENNIYIGYKREGQDLSILPFFLEKKTDTNEVFGLSDGKKYKTKEKLLKPFEEKEISRELKFASDTWRAGDIEFKIITPFWEVADPHKIKAEELRFSILPAIFAKVTLNNSSSDIKAKVFFGMDGMGRLISEATQQKLLGGAIDRRIAFACSKENGIVEHIGWNLLDNIVSGQNEKNRLGNEVLLTLEVPAHTIRTFTLVFATFQDGMITSGHDTRFAYTSCFRNIEDVLEFALDNKAYYLSLADKRDAELQESGLNKYRRFLIAQAAHSYLANTQLMLDNEAKPVWVVNEGEYQMMNTFDLTVDHIFWEMRYHPWTVKNVLDLFVERYSYTDKVIDINGRQYPGGVSFAHDMGFANMFSNSGSSVYERKDTTGCFSYMTYEQLLNWILCASVYAFKNNDFEWLKKRKHTMIECFDSLAARDLNNDGIMDADSIKCGSGYEITTYDSLDESLGRSRNNLYIAVKTWAALVCLENVFSKLKLAEYWLRSQDRAILLVNTLSGYFIEDQNFIPAIFENGNSSRIIPAIEGLVYPYIIKDYNAISSVGRYGKLIKMLKLHMQEVLKSGVCIDDVSGGWKLSSTSNNTWMSKIFLNQYISENVLNIHLPLESEKWDKVHAIWQANFSELCAVDQINSENGKDLGSRLYPRLVTSILWMDVK